MASSSLARRMLLCALSLSGLLPGQDTPLAAGTAAPDFVAHDAAGGEVRLADFAGKVVVLDFWATWCGPCIAAMPHLETVAAAHRDDVVAWAVCTGDSRAKFLPWLATNQAKYGSLRFACEVHDRGSDQFDKRASSALYRVSGLPTKFVIDKAGKIVMTIVGHEEGDARLEAGLARAGVKVDAEVAARGEAQAKKAAEDDARRAAALAANPPPMFQTKLGVRKSGELVPDLDLLDAKSQPTKLSALRGKPLILGVMWPEITPLSLLKSLHERYSGYGVQLAALFAFAPRQESEQWLAAHPDLPFTALIDPVGKFEAKEGEQPDPQAMLAFHQTTAVAKLTGAMGYPGMPFFVVLDAEGKFVGYVQNLAKHQDGLANLLLRAGVKLADQDLPKQIAPADAFVVKDRPVEAPVAPIAMGTAVTDFAMTDVHGQTVSLAALRGKVVVLDFWATWCGPCKQAMPHVQEVAKQYAAQGVVVVASCTSDARAAFEQWVHEQQAKYPDIRFAHDPTERAPERASRRLFGVTGIPATFVIDREGKVVASVDGYTPGEVLLDAALAKAGVQVDPAVLAKAAQDQSKRDAAKAARKLK